MIVLCIVLLALFCIAFIRAGIIIEYAAEGFTADVKVGVFRKKIYPKKRKEKSSEKKKSKKNKEAEPEESKKGGDAASVKQLLPNILEALKKICRKLMIDDLVLHITVASDDPYRSAVLFGEASAGLGMLMPVLDNLFVIKNRDVGTSVSFTEAKTLVYIKAKFTLRLWEIFYIAFSFGIEFVKVAVFSKKRKVEQ